jgi:hypothetical protein
MFEYKALLFSLYKELIPGNKSVLNKQDYCIPVLTV